jgi:Fe-S cluster biogenesis protein NfuA
MYELLNEEHHPVIEQHGGSVIFTIKNQQDEQLSDD